MEYQKVQYVLIKELKNFENYHLGISMNEMGYFFNPKYKSINNLEIIINKMRNMAKSLNDNNKIKNIVLDFNDVLENDNERKEEILNNLIYNESEIFIPDILKEIFLEKLNSLNLEISEIIFKHDKMNENIAKINCDDDYLIESNLKIFIFKFVKSKLFVHFNYFLTCNFCWFKYYLSLFIKYDIHFNK
jgi:hypothetical protein